MSNIRAVAKAAGLSVATVSRAFSQPGKVAEKSRERVFEAAREVGYKPNSLARLFRSNRSDTIVVMIPDLANSWFSRILKGIERTAAKNNLSVFVSDTRDDSAIEKACVDLVETRRADGLIQLGASSRETLLDQGGDQLPFVHAVENPADTRSPGVCIDNVAAAEAMVDYLLSLGHRDIGVAAGREDSEITRQRLEGFRNAMRRAGLDVNKSAVAYGDYSLAGGAAAAQELLKHGDRPTALFCMSDDIAIGAMSSARELGIRLPDELSVTGFDNIEFGAYCHPALTTVTQPAEQIGEVAMELMAELLSGRTGLPRRQVLPTELVIRRSAAPPIPR